MQSTLECIVNGCGRSVLNRELCSAHYQRLIRHGDVRADIPLQSKSSIGSSPECSLDGCDRRAKAKGLCDPHYSRVRRNGLPSNEDPIRDSYRRYEDDYGKTDGFMRCRECGHRLEITNFNLKYANSCVRERICRSCKSRSAAARRINNQSEYRERERAAYRRAPELSRQKSILRRHKRRMQLNSLGFDRSVTRSELRRVDGELCSYCERKMAFTQEGEYRWRPDYANLDHIIPVSAGGTHTWENCALACARCNLSKGASISGWHVRPGHRLYKTS